MNKTTITAPAGLPFIEMSREFDAPRDVVFRAHTDPELLKQWLGPSKYEMVIDRWDMRDGGKWRYMHRDGDAEYAFHGVFHGEPTPDRFTQTFEFEGAPGHVSLESIQLEERDGRTTLRAHSVHQTVEARDAMVESGMEGGVQEGYERLDAVLERLAGREPAAATH